MSALTHTLLPEPVAPAIEQVRHLGQVDGVRLARHVAAEGERQRARRVEHLALVDERLEPDDLADRVRDLDADDVLARDRRLDADRAGGEGHRQVVGERLDARHLDVMLGPDLVLGHDRPRVDRHDLGRDREAQQLLLDPALVRLVVDARRRRAPAARGSSRSMPGRTQSIALSDSRAVGCSVATAVATRVAPLPLESRAAVPARPAVERAGPDRLADRRLAVRRRRFVEDAPGGGEIAARRHRDRRPEPWRRRLALRRPLVGGVAGFGRSRLRRLGACDAAVVEPTQRAVPVTGENSSRSCRLNASMSPRPAIAASSTNVPGPVSSGSSGPGQEATDPAATALGVEQLDRQDLERAQRRRCTRCPRPARVIPQPEPGWLARARLRRTSRRRAAGTAAASGRSRTTARSSRATSRSARPRRAGSGR